MTWELVGNIIGGIGLFLAGIELMRSGFKEAAGNSLRRILSDHTETTARGIFSGFLVSSAVQSASAVTITMIGFVNAHILRLKQAVTVVFGSNLGKITTAWMVATLGIKYNITSIALPLVGIGVLLKAFLKKRYQGYGFAVIGFALLFLGINILKESIGGVAAQMDLTHLGSPGIGGGIIFFLLGLIMTIATQSSGAGLVITLSAVSAMIIPLESAAVILIGLNLGTTSSAYFASMRTSPNARRLAASHILFNVICTVIGFLMLAIIFYTNLFGNMPALMAKDPILSLTVFYTAFIVMSLLIIVPLESKLVRWLKHHFHGTKSLGTPVYLALDKRKKLPLSLVLESLQKEVIRFGKISLDMLRDSLEWHAKNGWVYSIDLADKEYELDRLNEYIHKFAAQHTKDHSSELVDRIQMLVRATQHYGLSSDFSYNSSNFKNNLTERIGDETLDALNSWCDDIDDLVKKIESIIEEGNIDQLKEIHTKIKRADDDRRSLRYQLIEESMTGQINSSTATVLIDIIETTRRSIRELLRGTYKLWDTRGLTDLSEEKAFSEKDTSR